MNILAERRVVIASQMKEKSFLLTCKAQPRAPAPKAASISVSNSSLQGQLSPPLCNMHHLLQPHHGAPLSALPLELCRTPEPNLGAGLIPVQLLEAGPSSDSFCTSLQLCLRPHTEQGGNNQWKDEFPYPANVSCHFYKKKKLLVLCALMEVIKHKCCSIFLLNEFVQWLVYILAENVNYEMKTTKLKIFLIFFFCFFTLPLLQNWKF